MVRRQRVRARIRQAARMKECPAIIAALPREVKQLVRGWQEHRLPGRIIVYTNDFAAVACTGMGPARATLAVQAAMSIKPITALLSVGLAGACDPSLHVGDIVRAGVVVDTQSGERFSNPEFEQVWSAHPRSPASTRSRGSTRRTAPVRWIWRQQPWHASHRRTTSHFRRSKSSRTKPPSN